MYDGTKWIHACMFLYCVFFISQDTISLECFYKHVQMNDATNWINACMPLYCVFFHFTRHNIFGLFLQICSNEWCYKMNRCMYGSVLCFFFFISQDTISLDCFYKYVLMNDVIKWIDACMVLYYVFFISQDTISWDCFCKYVQMNGTKDWPCLKTCSPLLPSL